MTKKRWINDEEQNGIKEWRKGNDETQTRDKAEMRQNMKENGMTGEEVNKMED